MLVRRWAADKTKQDKKDIGLSLNGFSRKGRFSSRIVSLVMSDTGGLLRQVSSYLRRWLQPVDPEPAPKPLIRPVLDSVHTYRTV